MMSSPIAVTPSLVWDRVRMKREAHELRIQIKDLKRMIRSKSMASWSEWSQLFSLKNQATELYMIISHSRNRVHRQGDTLATQQEKLKGIERAYLMPG